MLDNLKKTEEARKEEIARIREANCTRSKDVLERLSSAGRIRVKGPDGQEVKMPEEERQSRIEEAQRGIVANCNPSQRTTTRRNPRSQTPAADSARRVCQPDQRRHSARDSIAAIRVEPRIVVRTELSAIHRRHTERVAVATAPAHRDRRAICRRDGRSARSTIDAGSARAAAHRARPHPLRNAPARSPAPATRSDSRRRSAAAAATAPSTPCARPRHPQCAAPTIVPARSQISTGTQSAVRIAHARRGVCDERRVRAGGAA